MSHSNRNDAPFKHAGDRHAPSLTDQALPTQRSNAWLAKALVTCALVLFGLFFMKILANLAGSH